MFKKKYKETTPPLTKQASKTKTSIKIEPESSYDLRPKHDLYIKSKRIFKCEKRIPSKIEPFCSWLAATLHKTVLYAECVQDGSGTYNKIRIVITEIKGEHNPEGKVPVVEDIIRKWQEMIPENVLTKIISTVLNHSIDRTVVEIFLFENVAKHEVRSLLNIAKPNYREEIKGKYKSLGVCEIAEADSIGLIIVCKEVDKVYGTNVEDQLLSDYFDLLSQFDEFGVIKRNEIPTSYISKKEFNEKYRGSWENFWR